MLLITCVFGIRCVVLVYSYFNVLIDLGVSVPFHSISSSFQQLSSSPVFTVFCRLACYTSRSICAIIKFIPIHRTLSTPIDLSIIKLTVYWLRFYLPTYPLRYYRKRRIFQDTSSDDNAFFLAHFDGLRHPDSFSWSLFLIVHTLLILKVLVLVYIVNTWFKLSINECSMRESGKRK